MDNEKKYTKKEHENDCITCIVVSGVAGLCIASLIGYMIYISLLASNERAHEAELLERGVAYYHHQTGELLWKPIPKEPKKFNDLPETSIFAFENDPATNNENFQKAIKYNNTFNESAIVVTGNMVKVVRTDEKN